MREDRDVQGLVGDHALEPVVFLLEVLQATHLLDFHAAVLPAPAVVGLLGDADLSARLTCGFPL